MGRNDGNRIRPDLPIALLYQPYIARSFSWIPHRNPIALPPSSCNPNIWARYHKRIKSFTPVDRVSCCTEGTQRHRRAFLPKAPSWCMDLLSKPQKSSLPFNCLVNFHATGRCNACNTRMTHKAFYAALQPVTHASRCPHKNRRVLSNSLSLVSCLSGSLAIS
jgi:hypothetical protein